MNERESQDCPLPQVGAVGDYDEYWRLKAELERVKQSEARLLAALKETADALFNESIKSTSCWIADVKKKAQAAIAAVQGSCACYAKSKLDSSTARYPARKPAEVWPVGYFIENEMRERKWTKHELLSRLGGGAERELELDLLIFAPTKGVVLDQNLAADLARVFGTSTELWLDLDKSWQDKKEK